MHFHHRLGLILVLLFCTFLGNVLALPQSSHHSAAISSRGISAPSSPSVPQYHRRLKRIDADLDDGWHMSIENYEIFIPLGYAAVDMIRFYTDLQAQARRHASLNHPGLREFQSTYGVLKILFTANDIITWDFVVGFAEELLRFTRQGFLGAYVLRYWHDDGSAVNVKVSFVDETMNMLATLPIPGLDYAV